MGMGKCHKRRRGRSRKMPCTLWHNISKLSYRVSNSSVVGKESAAMKWPSPAFTYNTPLLCIMDSHHRRYPRNCSTSGSRARWVAECWPPEAESGKVSCNQIQLKASGDEFRLISSFDKFLICFLFPPRAGGRGSHQLGHGSHGVRKNNIIIIWKINNFQSEINLIQRWSW